MKKSCSTLPIIVVLLIAMLSIVSALLTLVAPLLIEGIAYADDDNTTYTCIMAPVRDLTGNSTAGVSTVAVRELSSGQAIFYLPESYYITNPQKTNFDYYKFAYAGLDTSDMYVDYNDSLVATQVTFSQGVSPFPDVRLQLNSDASVTLATTTITAADGYTIKALGYNEDGSQFYITATLNGTTLAGMVEKSSFTSTTIPYHAISATQRQVLIDSTPVTEGGNIAPNTSLALRIILIIGIAVPAVIIVILLFKPSKHDAGYGKKVIRRGTRNDEYDYDARRGYDGRDYDDRHGYDRRSSDEHYYDRHPSSGFDNRGDHSRRDYDRRLHDDYDRRD